MFCIRPNDKEGGPHTNVWTWAPSYLATLLSVVKKKHEWNSKAGEEEWMEKHWDMEGEGKGDGQQHGRKPRIPEQVLIVWKLT